MKDLIKKIKSMGYWTINVHPLKFKKNRIIKISECKKIMADSSVKLRGWDYPHIDHKGITCNNDWVESYSDWNRHCEYWRFYQSAQFIHYLACREDLQKDLRQQIRYANENAKSFLSIISTVYSVTEVFLFTSRLAEKELLKEGLSISIKLNNMLDRQLFFYDPSIDIFDDYICKSKTIEIFRDISNQEIITDFKNMAVDFVIEIFERFNMGNVSKELLKNEQRKFLEGKI